MGLADRTPVEGTQPVIYIGHRLYRDRNTKKLRQSRLYHAEYCADGRKYSVPLKVIYKDQAIEAAFNLLRKIRSGENTASARRATLSEIIAGYRTLIENRNNAPRTVGKYKHVLGDFENHLGQWANRPAVSFSEQDFWAFNNAMAKRKLVEKTRYDNLVIIKQMFKWAARTELIAKNPVANISMKKPPSKPQPCFTPEQVTTLLAKADEHFTPIIATMAYAGLRFGEVRDLRWDSIRLDQGETGYLYIWQGGSRSDRTKSGHRQVPINPELRKYIDALPRNGERVFHARASPKYPNGDGLIDERRCLMSLKRLCKRCGFAKPDQYKLHTLRHAFASVCASKAIPEKYILRWMGHTSSKILDIYLTMYDKTAEAGIKQISFSSPQSNASSSEGSGNSSFDEKKE